VAWEMKHRRTITFHELGGPLGIPCHQMFPWRQQTKPPSIERPAKNDKRPLVASPSYIHQGAKVGRLRCGVILAPGP
jgi:hypothetical protein